MPKLQYMRIPRLNNGAEGGSIEFSAVARVHRGKYALIGDIVYQRAYNAGKKLPPFKRIKPRRKERGQFLGYVQTPVRRKPVSSASEGEVRSEAFRVLKYCIEKTSYILKIFIA